MRPSRDSRGAAIAAWTLLSPSRAGDDLEEAFSRIHHELGIPEETGFRVIVEGRGRPLCPVIRDEVYRIAREALANAFRHSRASIVEVEFEYEARRLRVRVRDNGVGIDAAFLRGARPGHRGLSGMRERSQRMGGQLRVWSRAGAGTEVELSVPGPVAFRSEEAVDER